MEANAAAEAASARAETTPMLEQYRRLKAEHPGSILLFRMGDFYETFGEDALIASRVLGIALTSRDKKRDPLPLAGVPHHSVEGYLKKLVERGYSVAIAEQMESAEEAKGLVDRQVVEVLTPGTLTRLGLLEATESHYIVALAPGEGRVGVAVAEVSTGEFRAGTVDAEGLAALPLAFPAREVLLPFPGRGARDPACGEGEGWPYGKAPITRREAARFDPEAGRQALLRHFSVARLDSFGLDAGREGLGAAGALLDYLRSLAKSDLPQIREIRPLREGEPLVVDEVTLRNLEVFDSPAGKEHSLLHLLDRTETSMGARALRGLLRKPARESAVVTARLDRTACFAESAPLRAELAERLHRFPDLERTLGLLGSGRAAPRDLGAVRDALRRLPAVRLTLEARTGAAIGAWREALPDLSGLAALLEEALMEELPLTAAQGGIIRPGFDPDLDAMRSDAGDGREQVLALEARERARSGIPNLKVGYNRVFGYYIEVTRSQLARVPEDYLRKQTLAGAERYVTPELKRMEERIEAASVESRRSEAAHFHRLRERCLESIGALHDAARVVAELDLYRALGETAARERWTRPALTEDRKLVLKQSRHPMVERALDGGAFVPNDCALDGEREQIWLITGPNMGGKSTFLRQVGLAVYLAQVGSYVPAAAAEIGLADRIFTRVGASDQIARGASTFFVEMEETATILRQATDRSLVLLDEVGRGTSTYDGLSLAWAVTEALHEGPRARPRTLFATHYHELTDLEATLPRLKNRNVRVSENEGRIVFLHAIAPGRADRSYGIHVAQLAGVPGEVLARAEEILARLEREHAAGPSGARRDTAGGAARGVGADERTALLAELADAPVERLTPLDALQRLASLRDRARGTGGTR
ncbi:MAG TPA: DNA mismatch repair protein MutS [Candidatus Omnitrophota bacterium]|nr:DNA mismatch repair protein MutS [Candidatus Omnitrophota bacterium]